MLGIKYVFFKITPEAKAKSQLDDALMQAVELEASIEGHQMVAESQQAQLAVVHRKISRLTAYVDQQESDRVRNKEQRAIQASLKKAGFVGVGAGGGAHAKGGGTDNEIQGASAAETILTSVK